ncbi:Ribokinase [hydrothermal vent metagenome]|uniref:Ribokinase n=1 Tax=hydrothermal vent metagenome TaxID=652676 RepID=A0A3B0RQN2_9ZZZZ
MSARIAVVGSINHDIVVRVPRHPLPGETIMGSGHFTAPGGKGANQAVAAARLGGRVTMVGAVGDDSVGVDLVAGMAADAVDCSRVRVVGGIGTGIALITLDDKGENSIVVSPGANGVVSVEDVTVDEVATAGVVLIQQEIPAETVAAAILHAGGTVILNPAPARDVRSEVIARVDVLVPNRSELAVLTGSPEAESLEDVATQAGLLRTGGLVVVTLGGDGAMIIDGDDVTIVEPASVDVVDTTAAGDAFCGALAFGLASGWDIPRAVRWGTLAGALATTQAGAQPSLPTSDAVARFAASMQ